MSFKRMFKEMAFVTIVYFGIITPIVASYINAFLIIPPAILIWLLGESVITQYHRDRDPRAYLGRVSTLKEKYPAEWEGVKFDIK